MPGWTRNSIKKKNVVMAGATGIQDTTESDGAGWAEAAAADRKLGFLNVEKITSNTTLYVYRAYGSRPDLMVPIDSVSAHLTITAKGVYTIGWPDTLGAATKTRVLACVSVTTTEEVIYELDDVYRSQG